MTEAPLVKEAEQVLPQLMADGMLRTVPVPGPALVTERVKVCGLKVAVTDWAAVIVTVHVPVPLHAPLQPVKVEPVVGAAVSVTEAPLVKEAEQVLPQLMPDGLLLTVPLLAPVLNLLTDRV